MSSAARALVSLFRQVNPGLLAKKDRGRGADMTTAPLEYGATVLPDRIEVTISADLLRQRFMVSVRCITVSTLSRSC